jgi:cyclophilin family peptidyl-prolyl cis-trans isomerase
MSTRKMKAACFCILIYIIIVERKTLRRIAVKHFIKYQLTLISITAILFYVVGCKNSLPDGLYAKIDTDKGLITAKLFYNEAPMTVKNFIGLAEGKMENKAKALGEPYYDGLTFHRVEPNFVIQGGCPNGNGMGGPGYLVPDEFFPNLKHNRPGILAMANAGPNTNGSQFYITLKEIPHLDGRYTVFGEVLEGLDVLPKIEKNDKMKSIKIHRIGNEAKKFIFDENSFKETLLNHFEQIKKEIETKISQQEAALLEQWSDLTRTESGLYFKILTNGKGSKPKTGDTIQAHYIGRLANGTEFDNSRNRGQPLTFPVGVNKVIKGWDEALLDMKEGETRMLLIPPDLAYGSRGAGNVIPPNSFLIFEVELIKVENE